MWVRGSGMDRMGGGWSWWRVGWLVGAGVVREAGEAPQHSNYNDVYSVIIP